MLREGPQPPPFDIVLMDLQMPEMDGLTATRLLRADPRFKDFPILAMTAHALVEERERCLQAGMNDHVTKPIDPDALFAALARWTNRARPRTHRRASPSAATGRRRRCRRSRGSTWPAGLKRVAGNRKLYRSLLEQFAAKQADCGHRRSPRPSANGDRELAERLAHTLKRRRRQHRHRGRAVGRGKGREGDSRRRIAPCRHSQQS